MKFEPNWDQYSGIQFLMQKSFGALFWDPGTRKTSTFLYAYKLLRDSGFVKRAMVASTTNIVRDVWPEEIEKWGDLDITYSLIQGGSARKRLEKFDLEADFYLVNKENLPWLYDAVGRVLGIDMLVVDDSDEGFRNRNTYWRSLKSMLKFFKRRYIGTGTPMPKGYMNLYYQMYLVDMGRSLGTTVTQYRNNYFYPGGFKGKEYFLREGADQQINEAIAERVHRVEKHIDVTVSIEERWVNLPSKAMSAYKELEQEFIAEWEGKTLLAVNAGVATQKLRQAANGAIYYDREGNWVEMHKAKIEALRDLIKELKGEPLLLAYGFYHDYEMMVKHGIKIVSYSETKGRDRAAVRDSWNRGEIEVLGGQIGAMSHGLNVQKGGHWLCYFSLTYELTRYEQFYQRLWRDGQKHDVRGIIIAAKDTIDHAQIDVLRARSQDQRSFLNAVKRRYGI